MRAHASRYDAPPPFDTGGARRRSMTTDTPTDLETPRDLASLVAYQDGTIVSRTLVKAPEGTVTLFAFDAGQALSEHTAPFDALLHLVDGRATVTVGGDEHDVATGAIIRLPANVPHAVSAPERFKMLLIMIRSPG
jgi:quercetin dioxygenase-like cupin family protein